MYFFFKKKSKTRNQSECTRIHKKKKKHSYSRRGTTKRIDMFSRKREGDYIIIIEYSFDDDDDGIKNYFHSLHILVHISAVRIVEMKRDRKKWGKEEGLRFEKKELNFSSLFFQFVFNNMFFFASTHIIQFNGKDR